MVGILINIAIGALCGFIASKIMNSKGGILWYILIGVIGGALGSWIASLVGIGGGLLVQILIGVAGTCLLIFLFRLIFKK